MIVFLQYICLITKYQFVNPQINMETKKSEAGSSTYY